jgi:hypothetical protein
MSLKKSTHSQQSLTVTDLPGTGSLLLKLSMAMMARLSVASKLSALGRRQWAIQQLHKSAY